MVLTPAAIVLSMVLLLGRSLLPLFFLLALELAAIAELIRFAKAGKRE
jgi:hypothetical protein